MDFSKYIQRLKERWLSAKKGPRTYTEEIAVPFLSKFNWDTPKVEHQMRLFWIYSHRFMKQKTPAEFKNILQWAADRQLHVNQVVKAMSTRLKK